MALPKEDLEYYKNILLTKREEVRGETRTLEDSSRNLDAQGSSEDRSTYSLHMADHGTDAMEREKNLLLVQRGGDYLEEIDAALERIENGTYGICRVTGKEIAKARMEAVPTTTLSVEGKMQEKNRPE